MLEYEPGQTPPDIEEKPAEQVGEKVKSKAEKKVDEALEYVRGVAESSGLNAMQKRELQIYGRLKTLSTRYLKGINGGNRYQEYVPEGEILDEEGNKLNLKTGIDLEMVELYTKMANTIFYRNINNQPWFGAATDINNRVSAIFFPVNSPEVTLEQINNWMDDPTIN